MHLIDKYERLFYTIIGDNKKKIWKKKQKLHYTPKHPSRFWWRILCFGSLPLFLKMPTMHNSFSKFHLYFYHSTKPSPFNSCMVPESIWFFVLPKKEVDRWMHPTVAIVKKQIHLFWFCGVWRNQVFWFLSLPFLQRIN